MALQSSGAYVAVRAIAHRMAQRWSHSDSVAEDVAQEAVVQLITTDPPPRQIESWLFVVTRRLCARAAYHQSIRAGAEAKFVDERTPSPRRSAREWMRLDIQRAFEHLSERDRQVLQRTIEGETAAEIAAAMGVRLHNVGQIIARARTKMRRLVRGMS